MKPKRFLSLIWVLLLAKNGSDVFIDKSTVYRDIIKSNTYSTPKSPPEKCICGYLEMIVRTKGDVVEAVFEKMMHELIEMSMFDVITEFGYLNTTIVEEGVLTGTVSFTNRNSDVFLPGQDTMTTPEQQQQHPQRLLTKQGSASSVTASVDTRHHRAEPSHSGEIRRSLVHGPGSLDVGLNPPPPPTVTPRPGAVRLSSIAKDIEHTLTQNDISLRRQDYMNRKNAMSIIKWLDYVASKQGETNSVIKQRIRFEFQHASLPALFEIRNRLEVSLGGLHESDIRERVYLCGLRKPTNESFETTHTGVSLRESNLSIFGTTPLDGRFEVLTTDPFHAMTVTRAHVEMIKKVPLINECDLLLFLRPPKVAKKLGPPPTHTSSSSSVRHRHLDDIDHHTEDNKKQCSRVVPSIKLRVHMDDVGDGELWPPTEDREFIEEFEGKQRRRLLESMSKYGTDIVPTPWEDYFFQIDTIFILLSLFLCRKQKIYRLALLIVLIAIPARSEGMSLCDYCDHLKAKHVNSSVDSPILRMLDVKRSCIDPMFVMKLVNENAELKKSLYFKNVYEQMADGFDETQCGKSKGCTELKADSCYYVDGEIGASYRVVTPTTIEFEIFGPANTTVNENVYVSLGFSNDEKMNDISVIECSQLPSETNPTIKFSYNLGFENVRIQGEPSIRSKYIQQWQGRISDGNIYCKGIVNVSGDQKEPQIFKWNQSQGYHLMFAAGSTNSNGLTVHTGSCASILTFLDQLDNIGFNDATCGVTKGCFTPTDCEEGCDDIRSSWSVLGDDKIHVELTGKVGSPNKYVAMGFSTNGRMENTSVIECSSFNYSGYSISFSYNQVNGDYSNIRPVTDVSKLFINPRIQFIDGVLYCSADVRVSGDSNDPTVFKYDPSTNYSMIMATGDTITNGTVKNLGYHNTKRSVAPFQRLSDYTTVKEAPSSNEMNGWLYGGMCLSGALSFPLSYGYIRYVDSLKLEDSGISAYVGVPITLLLAFGALLNGYLVVGIVEAFPFYLIVPFCYCFAIGTATWSLVCIYSKKTKLVVIEMNPIVIEKKSVSTQMFLYDETPAEYLKQFDDSLELFAT